MDKRRLPSALSRGGLMTRCKVDTQRSFVRIGHKVAEVDDKRSRQRRHVDPGAVLVLHL